MIDQYGQVQVQPVFRLTMAMLAPAVTAQWAQAALQQLWPCKLQQCQQAGKTRSTSHGSPGRMAAASWLEDRCRLIGAPGGLWGS